MARLVPAHSERREVKDVDVFSYWAFQPQNVRPRNAKQREKMGNTYPNPSASDKKTGPNAHLAIDAPGRADESRSLSKYALVTTRYLMLLMSLTHWMRTKSKVGPEQAGCRYLFMSSVVDG